MLDTLILLVQIASTLLMTGVIWMTQLTQYPSFQAFREGDFVRSHGIYRGRIAYLAAPLMILEMGSSILLLIYRPAFIGSVPAWIGLALVVAVWVSMFLLQVPLHERLSKGFDREAVHSLVRTNWIRTCAWTFRSAFVLSWAYQALNR